MRMLEKQTARRQCENARLHSDFLAVCILAAIGLFAGCAESERQERVTLSGAVTYQGHPAVLGSIRFVPPPGADAPACVGDITDGRYSISGRGGIPVGKYKVEITAYRLKKDAPLDHKMNLRAFGGDPFAEQYIPEKYNIKTTLKIDIPGGSAKINKNFTLND